MPENAMTDQRIVEYYVDSERQYRSVWGLYEHMALHYGFWGRGARDHGEALRDMNEELRARAGVGPQDRVLDAGCGVGGSAIHLASAAGCRAVGINIVERQLELARTNARRLGVEDRVEFVKASYLDSGFEAGSFDVVWLLESSCHVADKGALLAEMHRVLKPGGRLVLADYFRRTGPMSASDAALIDGWADAWAMARLPTIEELTDAMVHVGFAAVRSTDETDQIARSARRMYYAYFPGVVLKALQRLWDKSSAAKRKNVWSAWAQERSRAKGLWTYRIVTARKPEAA
ncbi:methyltransferase domain-containing protein [Sorangium sp. So ce260]|uniref:SAM-dependent methyltransferase n=1 Tax=Sorangium sp. So ce260 TaxID=3133291 RepID=UPI003F6170DE